MPNNNQVSTISAFSNNYNKNIKPIQPVVYITLFCLLFNPAVHI